jgi:Uma2 family endonuclease
MVVAHPQLFTLESFLKQPETKPASEYIRGAVIQKPMPKARHSRLQGKLTNAINAVTEEEQIAYAFPELRCTFAGRSIVPDIAVLLWDNIPFDEEGEPLDNVLTPPDWTIEILSPGQSANRVTGNILSCLQHGCQLGWLVDADDRSIIVFQPQKQPELLRDEDELIILKGIELKLTAAEVFDWLRMKAK